MSPILPKNELENSNFCSSLLGQKFFVHFLGELNKSKGLFEINRANISLKLEVDHTSGMLLSMLEKIPLHTLMMQVTEK